MVWNVNSKKQNLRLLQGMSFIFILSSTACLAPSGVTQSSKAISSTTTSSGTRFAGGQKAAKIYLKKGASGTLTSYPTSVTIPATNVTVPSEYNPASTVSYNPGVKAERIFDLDGNESKPSWLIDFTVGITHTTAGAGRCATFGGGGTYDVADTFRASELDCAPAGVPVVGSGSPLDPVFMRIILDRNTSYIGSNENLMIQVEYQASGMVPYTVQHAGIPSDPDSVVDQLWKVFWSAGWVSMKPFANFVPTNHAFCSTDASVVPGTTPCGSTSYKGASIHTKQIIIPLSAYPSMNVIQFSRLRSWVTDDAATSGPASTNVSDLCGANPNSPLCLGVVVHSVTLQRI